MTDKNILLLQGPMGPFFQRFAHELEQNNMKVVKVNFNAGDWFFFQKGISYKGEFDDWVDYLDALVVEKKIDQVFLFGDERSYHRVAIDKVFSLRNIDVYVFEEGYLRPSFITLEKGGVNGNSLMPKDAAYYRERVFSLDNSELDRPVVKGQFLKSMLFSMTYGLAKFIGGQAYKAYQHHRCLSPIKQGSLWLWGWLLKKPYYHLSEKKDYQYLSKKFKKDYFFVPLQVHNDFQILHSPYGDVSDFIEETVISFAAHASKKSALVFKHHPMDRPYRNYKKLLQQLTRKYQLEGRLFYLHDQHLPTLLHNARATIVINSTVGLSSLHHNVPVLVRGTAVYDVEGLTSQSSLDTFWSIRGGVNSDLYKKYRLYLLNNNQGHGSFYQKGTKASPTGIYWPSSINMCHIATSSVGQEKQPLLPQNMNKPSVVQVLGSIPD
ncbi:MAG TPA: capsular biosynthesis protein [Leucothrix mucor]|nr:capsular biosynthesis protein [Leucothrix mucor]